MNWTLDQHARRSADFRYSMRHLRRAEAASTRAVSPGRSAARSTECHAGFRSRLPCRPFRIFLRRRILGCLFFFLSREAVAWAVAAEVQGTKRGADWIETRAMADRIAMRQNLLTRTLQRRPLFTAHDTRFLGRRSPVKSARRLAIKNGRSRFPGPARAHSPRRERVRIQLVRNAIR